MSAGIPDDKPWKVESLIKLLTNLAKDKPGAEIYLDVNGVRAPLRMVTHNFWNPWLDPEITLDDRKPIQEDQVPSQSSQYTSVPL